MYINLMTIIFILFAYAIYMDHRNHKERMFHLNLIDKLQNKLMARDYTEYALQAREKSGKTVTNPLMDRIVTEYKERDKAIRGEDDGG